MSAKTPRLDGPKPTGPTAPGASRISAPRRIATAGLLTLSMMIPLGAGTSVEVRQLIRAARSETENIGTDLGEVDVRLVSLPDDLRTEVSNALDSARAATAEARAALVQASEGDTGMSVFALADAQVALDAAFAQVRYVTDLAEASGSDVTDPLHRLQDHLSALRGEADQEAA